MTTNNYIRNYFPHLKGKDCITGCLRNLIHYYGLNLSEPMVFGIGMGLTFWYCNLDHVDAFPIMIGQEAEIEKIFCKNLGLTLDVKQDYTGDDLKKRIDSKLPTIVKADPYYLSYFWEDSDIEPLHFGEHVALMVDYDSTNIYISDIWSDDIVSVKYKDFLAARTTTDGIPYLLPQARWFEIEKPKDLKVDYNTIGSILYQTCKKHLTESEPYGISGIKQAATELPIYILDQFKKSKSHTIYILNSISMRMYEGDDNTMFRKIFFDFVHEYTRYINRDSIEITFLTGKIIQAWKKINKLLVNMAEGLEEKYEAQIKDELKLLKIYLLDVAFLEESVCQSIMTQLKRTSKNYNNTLSTSLI